MSKDAWVGGPHRHFSWLLALCLLSLLALAPGTAAAAPPASPEANPAAVAPIRFPQDEAPHTLESEWWYYTGHLVTPDGRHFGFEEVFFHGHQGLASGYAANFAITDDARHSFAYAQRRTGTKGVAQPAAGFDLTIGDWSLRGANGHDAIAASMPGYAISLSLTATTPPVLQGGTGYISYGATGGSYYYSRPRMTVAGTLTVDGETEPVTGEAWMDHQWGDFSVFRLGGWSWYSVQLDDGTDLMLYLVRDTAQRAVLTAGTLIAPDGAVSVLGAGDFAVSPKATWTSPHTGRTYAAEWRIALPHQGITLTLTPTVADQEVDSRRTTGVVYWEGEVTVQGTSGGRPAAGRGYVELVGET